MKSVFVETKVGCRFGVRVGAVGSWEVNEESKEAKKKVLTQIVNVSGVSSLIPA